MARSETMAASNDSAVRAEHREAMAGVDYGGDGPALHFLHANGYPPQCYQPLIKLLTSRYHTFGMLLRPLWPGSDPAEIRDWKPFSEDLRRYLGEGGRAPAIGIGHSIGAVVTLRSALQEPVLFRALVLIDPVFLPTQRILQFRLVRALGLGHRLNRWMGTALRRRRSFDDLGQLIAGYRRREIFRYFTDAGLRALVQGITHPKQDGGYELVYSPEWEARIYETGVWNDLDLWSGLHRLTIPTLIIRGAETDTFWEQTARLVVKYNPQIQIVTIPEATHLVPMERPEEVFRVMEEFLEAFAN